MGASKNPLKARWRRCKTAQNAHVLPCTLRFFAFLRFAIIALIEFLEAPPELLADKSDVSSIQNLAIAVRGKLFCFEKHVIQ